MNPELITALCTQLREEAVALELATNSYRSITDADNREIIEDVAYHHVINVQKLALAMTREIVSKDITEISMEEPEKEE